MQKKYYLLLIVIVGATVFFWKDNGSEIKEDIQNDPVNSASEQNKSDSKQIVEDSTTFSEKKSGELSDGLADSGNALMIKKNIKKELSDNAIWPLINDYSITEEELIAKYSEKTKELGDYNQKLATALSTCLEENFCGMEAGEGNPYFDSENTPGHALMARALKLLKATAFLDDSFLKTIDSDNLLSYLLNENAEVQLNALEILVKLESRNQSNDDTTYKKMLQTASSFKDSAKGTFYSILAGLANQNQERRDLYLLSMKEEMGGHDLSGKIAILENLDKLKLNDQELIEVTRVLCRVKTSPRDGHNWVTIESILKNRLGEKFNYCR